MCDDTCLLQNERIEIFNILKEFKCLTSIIDDIEKNYTKKYYIGKITTLIAESGDFIYYGGPKLIEIKNENRENPLNSGFIESEKYSRHYNFLKKIKKNDDILPTNMQKHCLCFHCIDNLCYIKNIHTNKIYTIGESCIHKFETKRLCEICNNSHNNRKDNYCNDCRIIIKKENKEEEKSKQINLHNKRKENEFNRNFICKFGKYTNCYYNEVFDDKNYIQWAYSELDMNKKNNMYFLIKLYQEWITNKY